MGWNSYENQEYTRGNAYAQVVINAENVYKSAETVPLVTQDITWELKLTQDIAWELKLLPFSNLRSCNKEFELPGYTIVIWLSNNLVKNK